MLAAADDLVIDFADADPGNAALLGGKGAGLAQMSRLGIPVPPGFILSTAVCHRFLEQGRIDDAVVEGIDRGLRRLEAGLGRRLGDPGAPLLLSVRSGAPVSMPGMMDTVLNLGLTEATLAGLSAMTGDARFAQDCYVRLLRSYGTTVRGIDGRAFDALAPHGGGPAPLDALRRLSDACLALIQSESGQVFPQDPRRQLHEAIGAVFSSWNSSRAIRYRRYAGIPDTLGSAVVVQAMVFGNLGERSGTGVAFTRDPATGEPQPYGDFLANAQGEDVVAGEHDVQSLDECLRIAPEACHGLHRAMAVVEAERRDMCEVEFTIEAGRLWMLQTRVGQRTATAALRIALDLLEQGLIDVDEAIGRITPNVIARLADPVFAPDAPRQLIGTGTPACPGAAVGRVALSSASADAMAGAGDPVILVRPFTSPSDVAGMIAARGVVTARGGRTSHAAVVARGMNRPAVCGIADLAVDIEAARFGGTTIREGDLVSIDGALGEVYRGAVPLVARPADPRVETLLAHCDRRRRVPVLSEAGVADWADGIFTGADHAVCCEVEDVERAIQADVPDILVVPGGSANARGLVATAVAAAAEKGIGLWLRAAVDWPSDLPVVPAGPWRGVVAGVEDVFVARLLAATLDSIARPSETV